MIAYEEPGLEDPTLIKVSLRSKGDEDTTVISQVSIPTHRSVGTVSNQGQSSRVWLVERASGKETWLAQAVIRSGCFLWPF